MLRHPFPAPIAIYGVVAMIRAGTAGAFGFIFAGHAFGVFRSQLGGDESTGHDDQTVTEQNQGSRDDFSDRRRGDDVTIADGCHCDDCPIHRLGDGIELADMIAAGVLPRD